MNDLIEKGYEKSIEILRKNSTPLGFSASIEKVENYYSIWARDHSICSIASTLAKDKELIKTSKQGIFLLLRHQIDHGQVPTYIEIENRKKVYGGLGSITSVDSNMWVIIAAAILLKATDDKRFLSKANMLRYRRFYRLFKAFDSNDCGLIEVPKAGDWADVFNRSYHVLYVECLYYQSLKSLIYLFSEGLKNIKDEEVIKLIKKRLRWLKKRRTRLKKRINHVFWFTIKNIPDIKKEYMIFEKLELKDFPYYQSHLIPFKIHWQYRFDSFGNLLSICTKIANKNKSRKIIRHILTNNINKPFPMKALSPPVFKKNRGWEPIYEQKEQPYTYHNGGIWPLIAGFWVQALVKNKYSKLASLELESLAKHLKKQKWNFNEYMHGKTGKPMGKVGQAWSAAGYIIGYHAIKSNSEVFSF